MQNRFFLQVSRDFHPNFSAKWRRYFYIFPITDEEDKINKNGVENPTSEEQHSEKKNKWREFDGEEKDESKAVNVEYGFEFGKKPRSFSVHRVNQLLLQLEGKSLSYRMFARDTKASRST